MNNHIKILMLTASLSLTGTHRILMDLLDGLDKDRFKVSLAYKPAYPGPGDDLAAEIAEKGFQVYPLRGQNLFSFTGLLDLYRIVTSCHIDIIHCWDSLSIAARFIGKLVGAKTVDAIGNPPVKESIKYRLAKRASSVFLDGVIFQSKESQEVHRQNGANFLHRCNQAVIYNCVDVGQIPDYEQTKKRRIREAQGFSEKDIILTNLGMYNEQKAQEYLIHSLHEIRKRFEHVRLFLVGWGTRNDILSREIRDLNLGKHVILTGKKSRAEVFNLLAITDIYVSSSLWEGLPVAVLEAMAFGLPVVATDVIGNREAVSKKRTGILTPPRDTEAMAQAICTLIASPDMMRAMGNEGRRRAESLFNPESFISAHESFYEDLYNK